MAEISAKLVKELRDKTGAGMMDCKAALAEANGNVDEAVEILRKKGIAKAAKKASRSASEGIIATYMHHDNKLAALVEINCETDFVAKNEDFVNFANEIAMQVAVTDPIAIDRESVPQEIIDKEMEIYKAEALQSGKPENVVEKIATGKLEKFLAENVLLEQEYFKDSDKKIKDLLTETIAKIGENIVIKRFARLKVGE
ncbi:MAG: translation elongation factor Ts [Calditrichia bacterium]